MHKLALKAGYLFWNNHRTVYVCKDFQAWFRANFGERAVSARRVYNALPHPGWLLYVLTHEELFGQYHFLGWQLNKAAGEAGFKWSTTDHDVVACDALRSVLPFDLVVALLKADFKK